MAVDLHHVFPGIGVGGSHPGEQHFIDDFSLGTDDLSQVKLVGTPLAAGTAGAKDLPGDLPGPGAAETDDAYARLT